MMNPRIISALVSKDLSLFFRNRFIAVITVLGIVAYLGMYFAMPGSVNETLEIAFYAPVTPPVFDQMKDSGLELRALESERAVKEAVKKGEYLSGIVLPTELMQKLVAGQKPTINLYFGPDVPVESKEAVEALVTELLYLQSGEQVALSITEHILGPDLVGKQISLRDRIRPMFVVFLVMFETFGLANLITEEVERGTIRALLVTPMSIKDLFVAKGITGICLALSQGVLFMAIVGGMNARPLVMLVALFLGAVLATGVSFIVATMARDFMSVLGWGVIVFIILIIPSMSVLFPGTVSGWIRAIPSYYLIETVHQATNFRANWDQVGNNLLTLLGIDLVLIWVGIAALRRKAR